MKRLLLLLVMALVMSIVAVQSVVAGSAITASNQIGTFDLSLEQNAIGAYVTIDYSQLSPRPDKVFVDGRVYRVDNGVVTDEIGLGEFNDPGEVADMTPRALLADLYKWESLAGSDLCPRTEVNLGCHENLYAIWPGQYHYIAIVYTIVQAEINGQLVDNPYPGVQGVMIANSYVTVEQSGSGDGAGGQVFEDVGPGQWYFDPVEILWDNQVTTGCRTEADGRRYYCPNDAVIRGDMAVFLGRADGLSPRTDIDPFTDDNGRYYEPWINAIYAAGITTGKAPGVYDPSGFVNRCEMASFLVRAAGVAPAPADYDAFGDDGGLFCEADINAIASAGITTGKAPGVYDPFGRVTRAEMAAFLVRAFNLTYQSF